jgi:hypothetical protein
MHELFRGDAVSTRPLLVTGLPRSGTSWVGKMLEASNQLVYVNEPLNPQHPPGRSPGVLDAEVTHRFQYICPDNDQPWTRAFTDTTKLRYHVLAELRRNHGPYDLARMAKYFTSFTHGRLQGRRALIDDPFAVLSARWFAERLDADVLVLVREPVSLVGSWRRLGWKFDFQDLLGQPLLLRDLLGGYEPEMQALVGSPDRLAQIALLWRVTYAAVHRLRGVVPRLRVVRYEDLSREPVEQFQLLYEAFGLTWSTGIAERVAAATSGTAGTDRSHAWTVRYGLSRTAFRPMDSRAALRSYETRLTPEEISRVRELTADVAGDLYPGEPSTGAHP